MRPQSEIRVCLSAALLEGPGTTRQLAQRTGWSIGLTRCALDNMVRAGDAHKPYSLRVPGVKRPVPLYARCVRAADMVASNDDAWQALQGAWRGLGAVM